MKQNLSDHLKRNDHQLPPRGLLLLFLASLSSMLWVCTSTSHSHYPAEHFESYHNLSITAVTMKDGSRIVFNDKGGTYTEEWNMDKVSRHVIGREQDGQAVNVDLNKALEVEALYKSTNVGGTILSVLGVLVVTFVVTVVVYLSLNPIRS